MWYKKIIWLLVVLLAGVMFVFENHPATLAILICVVFLPAISIISAALARKKISAKLTCDAVVAKNNPISGKLCITNKGLLPATVYGSIQWINMRTTETGIVNRADFIRGHRNAEIAVELSSEYCGKLNIQYTDVYLSDAFGLTKFELPDTEQVSVTVYPTCYSLDLLISDGGMSMMDSDHYSQHRPGNDPGETFAVREYAPGDMLKQIHWKLSQKTDKLMVREFGLPIVNQVLLLMEAGSMGQDSATVDAVTEMTASIGMSLVNEMQNYTIAWNVPETGELILRDVENENDVNDVLEEILALGGTANSATVTDCFSREMSHCAYTHVIVISPAMQSMTRELYSGNRVTQFLPQNLADGLQPDGTFLISFDKERLEKMYRIEV